MVPTAEVPVGVDLARLWEEAEEGAWQDPEFLKAFEDKGESVEVNDLDQKSANLVVIRDPANTPKP